MKCPICGSKDYYEGLYGPNCGNPDCGKEETITISYTDGNGITKTEEIPYSSCSGWVPIGTPQEEKQHGLICSDDIRLKLRGSLKNRIPKRKRLKRYGQ